MKESARLMVRYNVDSNGFETWRRLYNRFASPDATRAASVLIQLLDFRFNPSFEQDGNVEGQVRRAKRYGASRRCVGGNFAEQDFGSFAAAPSVERQNFDHVPADPRYDRGVLPIQARFDFGHLQLHGGARTIGQRLSRQRQRKERKRKRKERKRKGPR